MGEKSAVLKNKISCFNNYDGLSLLDSFTIIGSNNYNKEQIYTHKTWDDIYFTIYILTSIVISLTQPAIALSFPKNLAGKSLTSFNVLLFSGTFFMQWGIGLIIDYSKYLGFEEIKSYQIAFGIFLMICIFSYLYFIIKNKNE